MRRNALVARAPHDKSHSGPCRRQRGLQAQGVMSSFFWSQRRLSACSRFVSRFGGLRACWCLNWAGLVRGWRLRLPISVCRPGESGASDRLEMRCSTSVTPCACRITCFCTITTDNSSSPCISRSLLLRLGRQPLGPILVQGPTESGGCDQLD